MTESTTFTLDDGYLVISDATSGNTRWRGRPNGARVADIKVVPGDDSAVVLLDYMAHPHGPFPNLVRVSRSGAIVWTADLPTASSTDAYVSFNLGQGEVHAHSWSGYAVDIDVRSGAVRGKSFAK
jgi:hypothetical protein